MRSRYSWVISTEVRSPDAMDEESSAKVTSSSSNDASRTLAGRGRYPLETRFSRPSFTPLGDVHVSTRYV